MMLISIYQPLILYFSIIRPPSSIYINYYNIIRNITKWTLTSTSITKEEKLMSYEHFGILLRQLRETRKLTREQLSLNICTPKQIYRIEKGEYEPSLYLLNQLSIKFNMDLNEYFKMHFSNQSIIGFEGIKNINNAFDHNDLVLSKALIEKYEKLKEFKQGENLQHILYGKALYTAVLEENYHLSLDLCIQGIQIENPDFSVENIAASTYSNVGLSIINCISCNYIALNQQETGIKVLFDLLYVIDNYILSSPYPMYQASQFSKKIYQSTINNLSFQLMELGDIKQALHYVNIGIDFTLKENNLHFFPELLFMKFKLLYDSHDLTEASEYYQRVIYLYKITNQNEKLDDLVKTAVTEYPEIF